MTIESLINLNILISGNAVSVVLNLGGGRNGHLTLTMTDKEYTTQMGYLFVPPHNPGEYPPIMGTVQEQALGTERFRQN